LCWADDGWQNIGRELSNVKTLVINPINPKIIFAGTEKGIFKSEDGGNNWRNVFLTKSSKKAINLLVFDFNHRNAIYAATGSGLFYSFNNGLNWKRIFKGKNYLESDCQALAILPSGIYLGTKQGLFTSQNKGRSWRKVSGKLGDSKILKVTYSQDQSSIYIVSADGVFKSIDSGKVWTRVFVPRIREEGKEADNDLEGNDEDQEVRLSEIRYLAADPNNPNYLYLATSRGIYESKNGGISWEIFPAYGLLSRDVYFLLFSNQSQFYCISKSGIFYYQDSNWQELSFSLSSGKINFMALDKDLYLYACADKGLFRLSHSYNIKRNDILTGYSQDEPNIAAVQKAAIKYAEVEPEKIARWRKQAVKKAWLPQLSANFGRNTTDLWHWETGSSALGQSGDDLLRRGKDSLDWDVGLKWDLSELIWSTDQASIDVRSKLMVELRNDLLDEVNKIYFERIRVKMELDNLSIEDRKKRFEKELRLRELTASIDALTGGYFSQQLAKKKT
jgi:ligand-binding sensor domain-containing protein